jgi:osmotically-inducible protein OsmY
MANTPLSEAYEGENTKHGAIGHLSVDEALQQAVCEALIEDTELDSTSIGVRVDGETVLLEGCVRSEQARQRALSIASAQPGVSKVQAERLCISDA